MASHKAVGVVLVTTLLLSCDPPGNIGVTPLTPVGTLFTDTLTIRTSTVLADSVRTSSPDVFLAGRYVDPLFGTIEASSFIRFSLERPLDLGTTAVYDSLVLYTVHNYTYGDTLPAQKLSVHRLREQIDSLKNYYNNSRVAYDQVPLATKTFQAKPDGNLNFRLPDDLGKELFALSGKEAGKSNLTFPKVLNGLALIPDAKNTAIVGFPATSNALSLVLFYHTTSDTTLRGYTLPAIVLNQQTQTTVRVGFNRVTANRTGTPLANLKPLQPVPANATNARTYVQDALGIRTKIEIPYLKSLLKNGSIAVNRAELSIKPDLSAIQSGMGIPPYLVLLETDSTNRIFYDRLNYTTIVHNDASAYSAVPDPQVVLFDTKLKSYTWLITTHLNAILSGFKKTNSFLVAPVYTQSLGQGGSRFQSQLNNRVTRLVLSGKPEDLKLILFYTEAKE